MLSLGSRAIFLTIAPIALGVSSVSSVGVCAGYLPSCTLAEADTSRIMPIGWSLPSPSMTDVSSFIASASARISRTYWSSHCGPRSSKSVEMHMKAVSLHSVRLISFSAPFTSCVTCAVILPHCASPAVDEAVIMRVR